ncbi:MazG nucleotide pyrophosphohydrolase domain-containing protein [Corynebacterium meitnerae]|uniref:Nucleoside triphosphate hydrolase n=1 Tax=Corynebacterium meitnerae TaxID=2913498 RepID=A0A9X3LSF1_9CORY|nr:MazG nucleotide pyrophosphohydrolase domain-containing protein [Corynebacterium meitnerae]MCZ9293397.1 nucleoside triphosphate hydrolase [Corynebacterium meitnerae]
MSVLVLDPRWPDMIPLQAAVGVQSPVAYTDEVPVSVRWNFGDLARSEDPTGVGTLVTTDVNDPLVKERIESGEIVVEAASLKDPLHKAQAVMHEARARGEWEKAQTHESLLEYLKQETQELIDAVQGKHSDEELKKELSDLFLQVLFHAELADERGAFAFPDVAQAFVDKMKNRAPYLFDGSTGTVSVDKQDRLWEEGKRKEKSAE